MTKIKSLPINTILIILFSLLVGCATYMSAYMSSAYKTLGASEFAIAIVNSDVKKIKQFVSSGEDIEKVLVMKKDVNDHSTKDKYNSALDIALEQFSLGVTENKLAVVRYLLEQGAAPNGYMYSNDMLKFYDKSGGLARLIKPYRKEGKENKASIKMVGKTADLSKIIIPSGNKITTVASNKYNEKKSSSHKPPVVVKQKNQQAELEKMRKEIARLAEQIKDGNTVNNPAVEQAQIKVNTDNQKRLALVIGNSQYHYGPLKNPKNDASDIAKALKSLKFEVTLKVNVNHQQMDTAINKFTNKLNQGGVGLFYYAGHGVQVNGENYLIPIGAKINKQADVRYKAVNLGQVLDGMGQARNGLNIAILDACRDNPLPRSYRSSGNRGLARVNSPDGTLLAFATAPGNTASDGDGRNGLYTTYLLKHMRTKKISIERMLKLVSRDVKKVSKNKQTPWMESSFTGDFFF